MADQTDAATPLARRAWPPRRLALLMLVVLGTVGAIAWLYDRLTHVVINDARVVSHMVLVSSRVPGIISDLPAREGQHVRKGALLAQIDDREPRSRLIEAQADLENIDSRVAGTRTERGMIDDQTASRIAAQRSRLNASRSALASAAAALELARSEYQRAVPLRQRNVLSQRDLEQKHTELQRAEQGAHAAEADVATAQAALLESEAGRGALTMKNEDLQGTLRNRDRLAAEVTRLSDVLADHQVRSPVDNAVIDDSFVNAGEFVQPGQRMLLLHRVDDLWVKTNVKETDIRYLTVGKPVEVSVDAFPGKTFRAHVKRIGDSANNMFSLLPNPSPSGNFTKITQRLEVHIALDEIDSGIKPGMMVEVRVDK